MEEKLRELEERLGRLETQIFGCTYPEAKEMLKGFDECLREMSPIEASRHAERNAKWLNKLERCVGA